MSKNVFQAKMELNTFLKKHPELRFYQKQLDKTLNKAGSNHNRMVVLGRLINDNVQDLQKQLLKLKHGLEIFRNNK